MAVLRTLLASVIILVTGIGGLAEATHGFRAFTTETVRRMAVRHHPPLVPPLSLQTASGGRTSFGELRGRWLVVDFIYTTCTTYCSAQGMEFARLQHQLAGPITSGQLSLLSVSFDLARDDPAALADYQHRHGGTGAGWIAARPIDHTDLVALLRVFGVVVVPDGLGGFVHNAAIALVDPQGRLVRIVDWNDPSGAARYVTRRLGK